VPPNPNARYFHKSQLLSSCMEHTFCPSSNFAFLPQLVPLWLSHFFLFLYFFPISLSCPSCNTHSLPLFFSFLTLTPMAHALRTLTVWVLLFGFFFLVFSSQSSTHTLTTRISLSVGFCNSQFPCFLGFFGCFLCLVSAIVELELELDPNFVESSLSSQPRLDLSSSSSLAQK
jgi:hypothetical protein